MRTPHTQPGPRQPAEPPASLDGFDVLSGSADPAMIVVTAAEGPERAGCLVGFHCQASMDPLRYCVWLSKANHTYRVAQRATHLGVHFLAVADFWLAERFGTLTGDTADKFGGLRVRPGPGGAPLLADLPRWLAARRTSLLDEGGDHVCVVAEPVAVHSAGPFQALRLSQVRELEPGHGNQERLHPPTERADRPARSDGRLSLLLTASPDPVIPPRGSPPALGVREHAADNPPHRRCHGCHDRGLRPRLAASAQTQSCPADPRAPGAHA